MENSTSIDPRGLIAVAGGLFSICGALFNWDWFMNNRRAAFFVRIFGRSGARIFYGALGVFLLIVGGVVTFS